MSICYFEWLIGNCTCSHEQNIFTRIPLAFAKLFKTVLDWNYETTFVPFLSSYSEQLVIESRRPQKAFNGRSIYWPRGKMLGGTR